MTYFLLPNVTLFTVEYVQRKDEEWMSQKLQNSVKCPLRIVNVKTDIQKQI